MMHDEIELLVNRMPDPVSFAEEHCDWYADDYCHDSAEHGSDYSINDSAMDAIRGWAVGSIDNLDILRRAAP
jgi:hypothetical protein